MSIAKTFLDHEALYRGKYFFIITDKFPVSKGHLLIVSNEAKKDFFSLNEAERKELNDLILISKDLIEKDHTPDGYNIGMNSGEAAGQTIFHFHCHVIPRYKGDMEDPKGGIRHCIKGKGYY